MLLKVASYGGVLSFQLHYTLLSDDARSYYDADIELIVSTSSLHTRLCVVSSVLLMMLFLSTLHHILGVCRLRSRSRVAEVKMFPP